MSFDDLNNDLGRKDYSGEEDSFSDKFISKPVQKQYQPFGGPRPQPQPQPVQAEPPPEYGYEVQPGPYESPFSQEADIYDQAKKEYAYIKSDAAALNSSASFSEKRYKDFFDNKFLPFYQQIDSHGQFDNDDDYIGALDSFYEADLKASKSDDDDERELGRQGLKRFFQWNQPNGLRDQFLRFKKEKDERRMAADEYRMHEMYLRDQLTNIPPHARVALDEAQRRKDLKPRSKKQTDEMLDQMQFEDPSINMISGVTNLERTDPRKKPEKHVNMITGRSKANEEQSKRLAAAIRGDIEGFMINRASVAKDRQLRDRGFMFSSNGMTDGRPTGLSREDVDLLDIDDMRKLKIKQYKGVPIEEAFQKLGGEERLNVAKILQAVRQAYNNSEDSQVAWLAAGRDPKLKGQMETDRQALNQAIQLAGEFGLTDEMIEHNESKNFFVRLWENTKNAIDRGWNMYEQSKYADDFLTNSLSQSEIEDFIDLAEQGEKIPVGSAAKKFHNYKSKGFWDSAGNLLFENPEAIPELFFESMSAFLPAYVNTGKYTIPTGAAVGLATPVPGGTLGGAGIAARLNWGVASLTLEYSGMVLQGMQELGIDYKNPKIFAAAWNNESVRDKIKTKAMKKGVPIAVFDSMAGMLGGRISTSLHHAGNSLKGGKLLDKKAWETSKKTMPRFTRFQRARNIAGEVVIGDAVLGGLGETLGQAWSRDPGEGFDYNAIVAEAFVGLGPGAVGGSIEMMRGKPDVTNVPTIISGLRDTPYGRTGKIDLAGFKNDFNSFSDPRAMAEHIIAQGVYESDQQKQEATNIIHDVVARMYAANPESVSNLKLVIADRTPYQDAKQEGSYHIFDNALEPGKSETAIYINRKAIGGNPIGVFLHEGGHLARDMMGIEKNELISLYQAIGETNQKDTMAQYKFKNHGATYEGLDDGQKAEVDAMMKGMTLEAQADEWFSHQFVRVLTGNTTDKSVKSALQQHLKTFLYPLVEKYAGTREQAGSSADAKALLNRRILDFMGYDPRGFKDDLSFGQYQHERPGLFKSFMNGTTPLAQMSDTDALNHLMREITTIQTHRGKKEAKALIDTVNGLLGEKVLPTDMSLYTETEHERNVKALAAEAAYIEDTGKTAEFYETLEGEDAKAAQEVLTEESVVPSEQAIADELLNLEAELTKLQKQKEELETDIAAYERNERPKDKPARIQEVENKKRKPGEPRFQKVDNLEKSRKNLEITKRRISQKEKSLEAQKESTKSKTKQDKPKRVPKGTAEQAQRVEDLQLALRKLQEVTRGMNKEKLKALKGVLEKSRKILQTEGAFKKEYNRVINKLAKEGEIQPGEVSAAQILAELLQIDELQANALFTQSKVADDLVDVVSSKEPDSQRVQDAFEKYLNEVAGTIDTLRFRQAELRARQEAIENPPKPKEEITGYPKNLRELNQMLLENDNEVRRDLRKIGVESLEALGQKDATALETLDTAAASGNPTAVKLRESFGFLYGDEITETKETETEETKSRGASWKVVRRLPDGKYLLWDGKKWNPTTKVSDKTPKKYLKKKLDKKYFGPVAKNEKYKEALKSLKEGDRKYVRFWRDASAKPTKSKKKTAAKKKTETKPKETKKKPTKAQKKELKEIKEKLKLIDDLLEAIDPETAKVSIDWRDVPHFNYYFREDDGKDAKGNTKYKYTPVTLGQLADMSKLPEDDTRSSAIYQEVGKNRYKFYKLKNRTTYLWQYTNWRLAEKKGQKPKAEGQKSKATKTNIHWGKDENRILSNFSPVEGGLEYDGKTFATVEGAYQAYKSGKYVPGFEDLDGPEAQKKGKGVEVDKETNRDLMKSLIEIRYDTDEAFREALDVAGYMTHDVGDNFWKEEFPRILAEVRREKAEGRKPNKTIFDADFRGDRPKTKKKGETEDETIPEPVDPEIQQAFDPAQRKDGVHGISLEDYKLALDAARASAAYGQQIGNKTYPTIREAKGHEVPQPREQAMYFQTEENTSLAQLALFRLRMEDGNSDRPLTTGSIERLRLSEIAVYQNALGRDFEILDSREFNGVNLQRIMNLIERRAVILEQDIARLKKMDEAEVKAALDAGQFGPFKGSRQDNIDRMKRALLNLIFDPYAFGDMQEESGGLFPKVTSGKPWDEALSEYLFFTERQKVMDKILDHWKAQIEHERQGPGGKGTPGRKGIFNVIEAADMEQHFQSMPGHLVREYVTTGKVNDDITAHLKARVEELDTLREEARAQFEQALSTEQRKEGAKIVENLGLKNKLNGPFDPNNYKQLKPGVDGEQEVSTGGREKKPFQRKKVDEGIPVYEMFAEGREREGQEDAEPSAVNLGTELASEEIAAAYERLLAQELPMPVKEDFDGKDGKFLEIPPARGKVPVKVKWEEGVWKYGNGRKLVKDAIERADKAFEEYKAGLEYDHERGFDRKMREGLTSGLHVSPQQLAQWVYEKIAKEGRTPEKAMEALAWAPSSQVNKDRMVAGSDRMVPKVETLPGGPAGGLLPYVWVRFIKQAYELLNIDPNEVQKSSGENWTWDADSVMIDGKRVKNPMNIEGLPDPKIMFEQAKPILQRVLDAGRLEIERSTEDNLWQRDLQEAPNDAAPEGAPEGSMDNQETETKLGSGKIDADQIKREESDIDRQDETSDFRESENPEDLKPHEWEWNKDKTDPNEVTKPEDVKATDYADELLKKKKKKGKEGETSKGAGPNDDPALADRDPLTYQGRKTQDPKSRGSSVLMGDKDLLAKISKKFAKTPIHLSQGKKITPRDYEQEDHMDLDAHTKPKGLWYSEGSGWADWINREWPEIGNRAKYAHKLDLNNDRILRVDGKNVKDFESKYLDHIDRISSYDGSVYQIPRVNWRKVAQDWGGVYVEWDTLNPKPRRGQMFTEKPGWAQGWDLNSGVVWSKDAINSVKLLAKSDSKGPKSRGSSQSSVEEDTKFLEIFKKFKLDGLKERYPDISPRKLSMRAQYLLDVEANRERHPRIWRNDELVENTEGTLPEILYFPEAPLGMVDKDRLLLPEYFPRTSALRYGGRQNPPVMDVLKALRKDLMDLVKDGRKRGFNYGHLTDDPAFPKSDKDLLKVVNAMIQIVGRSKAHKFDGWRLFAEGESVKEEYKNRLKEDEKTGAFVINDAGTDAVPLGGVHYRNNLDFQTFRHWGIFLHELWHTVTIPMTSVLKAKDAIHDAVYPEEGTPEDAIRLKLEEFRIADEAEGKSPEEIKESQTVVRNAIASYKQFVPKEKAAHIAQAAYNLNALRVVALDEALRRIKAGTMEDHVFDQLRYGLMTDQSEFFMETMTRKETQEFLSEIRPTDEQLRHLGYDPNAERRPSTLLEVFYDAILGLFGIDRKTLDGTILQKVLWNAEPLMDTNFKEPTQSAEAWRESVRESRSLGSNYSLSSHAPEIDLNEHVSLISRIGSSDRMKGWKDVWKRIKDKLPGAKDGLISAFVNQADASSRVIEKFMRDAGVKDQALLDSLDIRGLWHQYYGKTDESVRQAQLQFIEPIEDALREHGISLEKFGSYLLARAAPSRNIRLKKMYQDELAKATKESDKKMLTKLLKEHGENLSGIHTDMAVELVKDFEKEAEFSAFIEDSRNPLQLFYDMNREALKFKAESGMIRSKQSAKGEFQPDIDEYEAMMQAASHFDWSKEGSKFTYMRGGKKSNYSYAPMQGFEGEAEGKLWDAESAFQVMGKSQTSSGKGWDQPKHKFLSKGSFGRYLKNSKTSIRDGDGNKEVVGPDPLITFKTAQEQFFDSSIRSHKNEVSTAYGTAFEIMRAVAYPDDALSETAEGPPPFNLEKEAPEIFQRMKEDPSITEKAREMFEGENAVFEKEFRPLQETKDYKIDEKKIQVDGKDVEGLSMVRKQIDTTFQNNPHVFVYRKSGVAHMIKFKRNERGSRVARSLKNLRYEPLPSVLQAPNKIVRFMASMFTSKNPLFWVPNMVRDLGTMGIHLTEDDKANMVKDAFNPKTLAGLMKGVWKVERDMQKGKATLLENAPMTEEYAKELLASGDYARMYQFAKQAGGKVGYFRHKPLTELIDEFRESTEQAKKKKGAVKKSWKSLWDFVDAGSSAFENAVRMSAFWSAIKTGRTVHQAANISRNISVDFNQKGELSQILGSQFVFFSASVNSADRMIQTFKKRGLKGSAKFVAKFAGAAFILATLNRLLDDEDEEKATSDFDTQSSYRRDSNAIVVLPDDKGSISIPMPLGYNAIWAMGNTLADAFWDSMSDEDIITPAEFITRNGMAAMNAFNPIGGANISTVLTPSWAKPVQEILTNEDFLGREITKEDLAFEVAKPTHMRTNDRTQQHWVDLDRKMNEWMGGNDTITGSMSGLFGGDAAKSRDGKKTLSGSDIEHLILGYTGGPGQMFNAIFGQGVWPSASEDYEEFNPNKTPFINKFYRANSHESYVRQRYYHTRIMVKTAEAEIKKAGNNKALANQIRADRKDLLQLSASVKYADGLRSKIRAQKNKIKNGNLTFEQKMQRIAKLEDKEHDALRTVVKKGQKLGLI